MSKNVVFDYKITQNHPMVAVIVVFVACCFAVRPTPSCSIILPVRLIILPLGATQQKSRLRHANTMPPHQNEHYKGAAAFGGGPFVVWVKLWLDGVGMFQPGLLLGRPRGKDY